MSIEHREEGDATGFTVREVSYVAKHPHGVLPGGPEELIKVVSWSDLQGRPITDPGAIAMLERKYREQNPSAEE